MKWIGQHIVDFIARFRSDVYLEDLATTTEANVLVVDADGKVSKNTSVAGDLTSIVAGTGLSGTDLTGPIPTLNVDAVQTQITQVGTLSSLVVGNIFISPIANTILSVGDMYLWATGDDIFIDSDNLIITSSTNDKPMIQLKATSINTGPSELSFVKDKGTGGIDNDEIGIITFVSDDSTEEQTSFASITAEVSESFNTDEAGRLVFKVAESNGTDTQLTTGLLIEGEHATDGEVDVTIAAGAASTTTVAGTLTMGSTATLDNSGNLLTNAATATALTAGDKTIDGSLTIGANTAGHDFTVHGATTNFSKMEWDASADFLKFSDNAKIVFGSGAAATDFDSSIQANGSNLVIYNDTGNIQIGDTVEITGNLTTTGVIELGHASDTTIARSAAGVVTVEGNQIITSGAINVDSEAQAPIGLQIARRTITTAEANSMSSTPIELIPAQGANTIIEVVRVTARVDRAATQSNSSSDMNLHYAGKEPGTYGASSLAHFRRFMYGKTTDIVERRGVADTVSGVTLTEDVDAAVEVSFDAAATNNCFTSIDMYVSYFVIDVS